MRLFAFLILTIIAFYAINASEDTGTCSLEPTEASSCGGETPFTLYYWSARGLTQPIRELFEFLKLNYDEVRFTPETAASYWEFKDLSANEGFPLINLPYVFDPTTREQVSESDAVLIWAAQKANRADLLPNSSELVKYTMLYGVLKDIKREFALPCYQSKDLETLKDTLNKKLETHTKYKMRGLSEQLGNNQWLMGDQIKVIDFLFAEVLKFLMVQEKELRLDAGAGQFANFHEYLERYNDIPEIRAYMMSKKYIHRPFNGNSAIWK